MTDKTSDITNAHVWLDEASEQLNLDPSIVRQLAQPLLDLTREVAHNRSRPAAPLTAFLVGLASRADEEPEVIAARVSALADRIAESR